MKNECNLPEIKEMFNNLMKSPESMFDLFRFDMRNICENVVTELLKSELSLHLGREKYERVSSVDASPNYRNGSYVREFTARRIGKLRVRVPRDRKGSYSSSLIQKYSRYEKGIEKDMALLFLSGLSTRNISLLSEHLLGLKVSSSEVSNVNKELLTGIDEWRNRSLSEMKIKYMYMDGVNFPFRVSRNVEKLPMLVVIGVQEDNKKVFLAIQQGDKECASTWREVFKDIKNRGLDHRRVKLGIMDGLPGLQKVFCEEFIRARVQRCQVHVTRNVLCKVPKKIKQEVADNLRDIFYADSRKKAFAQYRSFYKKYENIIPSAVKSLSNNLKECLQYYSFDREEWISLRTTNPIERVNKEFKRRTNPMEIMAGEKSAYRILCFIALKMELNWKHTPLGQNNLPVLEKFTQLT